MSCVLSEFGPIKLVIELGLDVGSHENPTCAILTSQSFNANGSAEVIFSIA